MLVLGNGVCGKDAPNKHAVSSDALS